MSPFTRRKSRDRPQQDDFDAVPPLGEPAPQPPQQTVGSILRLARQYQGGSLEQIAAALRIRAAYLEAIEEDRYDKLPGAAYAVGFVRSYAEHLGLDSVEVARRFKLESAALDARPDLSFPMPLPERSRPGGAILLVALILAGCAYGAWYYFSSGDRERPERVAAVPLALLRVPAATPAATAAKEPAAAAASPAPAMTTPPASAPQADTAGSASEARAAPTAAPAAAPQTPAAPSAPVAASPASAAPPPAAQNPVESATAEAEPAPSVPATKIVETALPPPGPSAAQDADRPPLPEPPPTPPAEDAPRVYGVTNGPARIVIRATADSWIQVKEDQNVLQTRILKPGEVYRVPDRPGITMRTGNAGGLAITVDGKPIPALGPEGRTRTVQLDPDRLAHLATVTE